MAVQAKRPHAVSRVVRSAALDRSRYYRMHMWPSPRSIEQQFILKVRQLVGSGLATAAFFFADNDGELLLHLGAKICIMLRLPSSIRCLAVDGDKLRLRRRTIFQTFQDSGHPNLPHSLPRSAPWQPLHPAPLAFVFVGVLLAPEAIRPGFPDP